MQVCFSVCAIIWIADTVVIIVVFNQENMAMVPTAVISKMTVI